MHLRAHRAGGKHAPAERARPVVGVVLHRQIERRLVSVGAGDRVRGLRAVIPHPTRHQPGGRVQRDGVESGEVLCAVARDPAQHRVDKAGVTRGASVGLRQAHGEIDRGVVRYLEPKDLRRADQQRGFEPGRVGGKPTHEPTAEEMPQRTEPAQHRCRQRAHQRPVAIRQGGKVAMHRAVVELLVERPPLPQHAIEDVGRDPARGKAGRFNAGRARGHARNGQARYPRSS
jgi:hypothetical protein